MISKKIRAVIASGEMVVGTDGDESGETWQGGVVMGTSVLVCKGRFPRDGKAEIPRAGVVSPTVGRVFLSIARIPKMLFCREVAECQC